MATEGTVHSDSTSATSTIPSVFTFDDLEAQLSPYLLHNLITLTTTLVTRQLVGTRNYVSWSKAMLLALSGKDKLGFIRATIKKLIESQVVLLSA